MLDAVLHRGHSLKAELARALPTAQPGDGEVRSVCEGLGLKEVVVQNVGQEGKEFQVRVLGADRVIAVNGQPAVRPMMTITLSSDHRVVDGAQAIYAAPYSIATSTGAPLPPTARLVAHHVDDPRLAQPQLSLQRPSPCVQLHAVSSTTRTRWPRPSVAESAGWGSLGTHRSG